MIRHRQACGYGYWAIFLHWIIAALIFGIAVLGYVMRRTEIDPVLQFSLYQWHKSVGFVALALAALQLLWWGLGRYPAPVASLTPVEKMLSRATHIVLVGLGLAVPVAGWCVASTSPLNIPTFFLNLVVIPHLPLAKTPDAETMWSTLHTAGSYLLVGLGALHALAALYHHFIRRDEVLLRMLGRPGKRPRQGEATASPSSQSQTEETDR